MTWQSAKSVAAQYLSRLNLPPDLSGAKILLADYETDADLKFLKSADEWPLEFHRMVNGALSREFRKRGAVVELVKITMAAYFAWLAQFDLANTPANRAQFISWSTAADPKPIPKR